MDQYLEFAGAHPVLTTAAALIIAALIATEAKQLMRRWRELSPQELTRLVNDGALLLDLRGNDAHRAGHIAGAQPTALDTLDGAVAKAAKDTPVVAYCESGSDSAKAAERLVAAGFATVATLKGGLMSWRADNLPLAKG